MMEHQVGKDAGQSEQQALPDASGVPPEASEPVSAIPSKPTASADGRVIRRTRIFGRVSIIAADGVAQLGSIHDLAFGGIAVMAEARLMNGMHYTLHLNIFRNGRLHDLRLKARCIHATLVGGAGFRHGFEFESVSDAVRQALDEVLL
ncbi:MAG: PilZ domain-containing protein [Betaproteobacteria bacterium]